MDNFEECSGESPVRISTQVLGIPAPRETTNAACDFVVGAIIVFSTGDARRGGENTFTNRYQRSIEDIKPRCTTYYLRLPWT